MKIITRENPFETIKHTDDQGNEYWLAREMQKLLGYVQWRNFYDTIEKAIFSCKNCRIAPKNHFANVSKSIISGKNTKQEIEDFRFTRYACYLVAMNGDPRKTEIAYAQSYFAIQTRKSEIIEEMIKKQSLSLHDVDVAIHLFLETQKQFPNIQHPENLIEIITSIKEDEMIEE